MNTYRTYREAFKKLVVEEISRGKFKSPWKAQKAYGIRGGSTVWNWVKKYGREDLLPQRIRIETMKERDELKEARKRIRELEAALSDSHVAWSLEQAYVDIACERMGVDSDNFKKKNAITLSDVRKGSKPGGSFLSRGYVKKLG